MMTLLWVMLYLFGPLDDSRVRLESSGLFFQTLSQRRISTSLATTPSTAFASRL
jgi:hypothetical protein